MEKIREEFEAWFLIASGVDVFSDRDGNGYKCEDEESTRYLCGAWLSWKASRSSLNVELPSYQCDQYYKDGVLDANKVFEALEKAGVSYK